MPTMSLANLMTCNYLQPGNRLDSLSEACGKRVNTSSVSALTLATCSFQHSQNLDLNFGEPIKSEFMHLLGQSIHPASKITAAEGLHQYSIIKPSHMIVGHGKPRRRRKVNSTPSSVCHAYQADVLSEGLGGSSNTSNYRSIYVQTNKRFSKYSAFSRRRAVSANGFSRKGEEDAKPTEEEDQASWDKGDMRLRLEQDDLEGVAGQLYSELDEGKAFIGTAPRQEDSRELQYGEAFDNEAAFYKPESFSGGRLGLNKPQVAKLGRIGYENETDMERSLEPQALRSELTRFGSQPLGSGEQRKTRGRTSNPQGRRDPPDERISSEDALQSFSDEEMSRSAYQRAPYQQQDSTYGRVSNQQGSRRDEGFSMDERILSEEAMQNDLDEEMSMSAYQRPPNQQQDGTYRRVSNRQGSPSLSSPKKEVDMTARSLPQPRQELDIKQEEEFQRLMDEGHALLNEGKEALDGKLEVGVAERMLYKAADLFASAAAMNPSSLKAVGSWANTLLMHGRLKLRLSEELRTMLPEANSPRSYNARNTGTTEARRQSKLKQAAIERTLQVVCEECEELLVEAGRKYRMALSIDRGDVRALYNWGLALCFRAQLIAEEGGENAAKDADKVYLAAIDKFEAMMGTSKKYAPGALLNWGLALRDRSYLRPIGSKERVKLLWQARLIFQDALRFDPNYTQAKEAVAVCTAELKELQEDDGAQSKRNQRPGPQNWWDWN